MAKKKVLCDTCVYYRDSRCGHRSNLYITVKNRLETVGFKSLEKKSECEFFKCLEN